MSDAKFYPPQRNALLTRLLQSISYLVIYFLYKIRLSVSDRDIAKLKAIETQRVVYLPNHSNLDDGLVMFLLSARAGQLFHYIVACEAFRGWLGKLLRVVGAYSIRRGVGDRASIIQTLEILQQPGCKLVIFPEGGCSYQNDTVMPFRTGGIELAFKAMAKSAKDTIPDLYLVPVSIKYYYIGKTDAQIANSLNQLEAALSIQAQNDDFYLRLRTIGDRVLTNLEIEYQIDPDPDRDWNRRIALLKQHLLTYCEQKLDIPPATQIPNRERVYKIQAILADLDRSDGKLDYQHLDLTAFRLLNFDAIYAGYVADKPTPERFFDTLDRIEREVFQIDRPKSKGIRRAKVTIGKPINAAEYWQERKSDRTEVIKDLTQTIQQTVQANLNLSQF